jgi:hypothetical protein
MSRLNSITCLAQQLEAVRSLALGIRRRVAIEPRTSHSFWNVYFVCTFLQGVWYSLKNWQFSSGHEMFCFKEQLCSLLCTQNPKHCYLIRKQLKSKRLYLYSTLCIVGPTISRSLVKWSFPASIPHLPSPAAFSSFNHAKNITWPVTITNPLRNSGSLCVSFKHPTGLHEIKQANRKHAIWSSQAGWRLLLGVSLG